MMRDHGDAGHHDVGVEEFARAEDHPAEAPGHGGEHLHRDQNAPGLRQAEPQAGEDVGQRAGQDHVAEQPPVVGAHGLRRAHPDFLHRLHAGPAVEDDRKRRHEADQQHGGEIAEPEPEQEQRRIGEAGDRRADAHQRQENILGPPRASHQHADGHAEHAGERKAGEQADHGLDGVMRQDAGDGELARTRAPLPPASETAGAGTRRPRRRSPRWCRPRERKDIARDQRASARCRRSPAVRARPPRLWW